MKILYIFPHPDDESFGPAGAISKQVRDGHSVNLLTLTKGGATKQRIKYNYSVKEMGNTRFAEMLQVKSVLGLDNLTILDFPDSGLKELEPTVLERAIEIEIEKLKPDILVTYAVHGISGFHDHLVTHAVVKSVFCRLRRDETECPKRLAFFTLSKKLAEHSSNELFVLNYSSEDEIDCIVELEKIDIECGITALGCYKTYQDVIRKSGILEVVGENVHFELFQESFSPQLDDIFDRIK